ncbi:ABC transporter permease [Microvirga brassicacearum]|uniref:ABC transporter permease n=1 Tax=Microvirga brassicacearum TaxID=2580413 RepID=A0A5N3P730_9HYPH|nr:ABC transporter permease [Microvirga brassicacearum]KAB0265485.1 ABC transporter permease [Microvirga brassicacearum]
MFTFIIKRLLLLIPVFLAVSLIIFMIVHLVPGDPLEHLMQVGSSPEQQAALSAKYGLAKPILVQYLIWLQNTLSGNFGDAIILRRPVADLIAQNMPYSLALGGLALAFSTLVGIGAGALAAIFKNSWLDRSVMLIILLGSTVPSFWLGLLMILLFAVQLGWFPVSGARSASALVLPALTIGLGGVALVARVTRAAMIDISRKDFVLMLHAKGVSRANIQLRHVLRHALLPVLTILSLRIGWILGGAVTVEFVFARPGLGSLLITSLNQRDYPVVQGCLLMLAIAVMLGTLLGDVLQAALDPRVRERAT